MSTDQRSSPCVGLPRPQPGSKFRTHCFHPSTLDDRKDVLQPMPQMRFCKLLDVRSEKPHVDSRRRLTISPTIHDFYLYVPWDCIRWFPMSLFSHVLVSSARYV